MAAPATITAVQAAPPAGDNGGESTRARIAAIQAAIQRCRNEVEVMMHRIVILELMLDRIAAARSRL